jgi:hypothetical protein
MPIEAFDVEQNGVKITVGTQKIAKGTNAGTEYNAPDVDKLTAEQITNFLGSQKVLEDILRPTFRRVALNIHKKASEDSKGDATKYKEFYEKMLKEFSTVGESLGVLKERLMDLLEQAGELSPKFSFDSNGVPTPDMSDEDTKKYLKLMVQTRSIQAAVTDRETEAEKRKAAKEAAAPAPVTAAVEA